VHDLKQLAPQTVDQFRQDVEKGVFREFHEYTTSFGVTISSNEEAIHFNSLHETLHLGYAMAMRKSL
jgi:hypothetical protein